MLTHNKCFLNNQESELNGIRAITAKLQSNSKVPMGV